MSCSIFFHHLINSDNCSGKKRVGYLLKFRFENGEGMRWTFPKTPSKWYYFFYPIKQNRKQETSPDIISNKLKVIYIQSKNRYQVNTPPLLMMKWIMEMRFEKYWQKIVKFPIWNSLKLMKYWINMDRAGLRAYCKKKILIIQKTSFII